MQGITPHTTNHPKHTTYLMVPHLHTITPPSYFNNDKNVCSHTYHLTYVYHPCTPRTPIAFKGGGPNLLSDDNVITPNPHPHPLVKIHSENSFRFIPILKTLERILFVMNLTLGNSMIVLIIKIWESNLMFISTYVFSYKSN